MLETFVSAGHFVRGDGLKTIRVPFDMSESVEFDSILSEQKAPVTKGDYVHALPYWSERSVVTRSNTAGQMSFLMGTIYLGDWTQRGGLLSDWPWPKAPTEWWTAENMITKADWTFNVSRFMDPGSYTLPVGSASEWESLRRLADTKALGNLRKALVNLPMIYAERRETLSMIGGKVAAMAKGANKLRTMSAEEVRRFKRMKPVDRRKALKRISNEHLEFVFGWLPVIGEIEGIAELISRDKLDFVRSRGSQTLVLPDSKAVVVKPLIPPARNPYAPTEWGSVTTTSTTKQRISVRTALRYKLTSSMSGKAYALGFEPLGTAFDLIPLSFLSGWISNFDYWIRTLTPLVGLEYETGSRSERRHVEKVANGITVRNSDPRFSGSAPRCHEDGSKTRDTRVVLSAPPESSLEWDVEVGLFEVTAGISLAIQRYLKPLKLDKTLKQFRYRGPRPKWLKEIRYTGRK